MKEVIKTHRKKLQFAAPVFMVGALSFALFSFGGNSSALIQDTEPLILIAQDSVRLAKDTQVSSGDIASNKSIQIAKNGIINGDLYSDRIQLAGNTSINGNVTSNKLIKTKTAEIFGEITNTVQKNIVELPQVPSFQTGSLSHIIAQDTTLNPGNYDNITINENATLTLTPGIYNLNKLVLEDNSKLLYSDTTIINVKDELNIQNNTLVASNNPDSTSTTELQINYIGKPPLAIGDNSFITAKILSPTSRVQLGSRTTFRGQIFAKDVNIGDEGILSRNLIFIKESTEDDVIIASDGAHVIKNEIVLKLTPDTQFFDALELAGVVSGQITGAIEITKEYQIEVESNTLEELQVFMQTLSNLNDQRIESITRNYVIEIDVINEDEN